VIIRIARLRWGGHVTRMEKNFVRGTVMYIQPEGPRKVGRPRASWRDDVGKDAGMLGIRGWRATAMNREEWRKLLKEAKTLYELLRRWWWRRRQRRRWWWWLRSFFRKVGDMISGTLCGGQKQTRGYTLYFSTKSPVWLRRLSQQYLTWSNAAEKEEELRGCTHQHASTFVMSEVPFERWKSAVNAESGLRCARSWCFLRNCSRSSVTTRQARTRKFSFGGGGGGVWPGDYI
jgi:hypothetical protein